MDQSLQSFLECAYGREGAVPPGGRVREQPDNSQGRSCRTAGALWFPYIAPVRAPTRSGAVSQTGARAARSPAWPLQHRAAAAAAWISAPTASSTVNAPNEIHPHWPRRSSSHRPKKAIGSSIRTDQRFMALGPVGADADTALGEEIAVTPANINDVRSKGGTLRIVATGMWGRDEAETLAPLEAWYQPIHRIRGRSRRSLARGNEATAFAEFDGEGLQGQAFKFASLAIAYYMKWVHRHGWIAAKTPLISLSSTPQAEKIKQKQLKMLPAHRSPRRCRLRNTACGRHRACD